MFPSLWPWGFLGRSRVFWHGILCFLATVGFWAIFCFIQFQMRGSFGCWLWAGKWKLCAAMREAFCVWQGTRAGSSTERTSGNHQAACALGALSLLVFQFLGGRLKLFLVYRLGDRKRKKKKPESPQPFLQPELLSTSLPERKCVCVCDQLTMVWVINMACWDSFSIPSWLSGSGLQRQTKSTLSLRSACCTFEGSLPSLLPTPHAQEACLRE